jgi:serine/threonine-protein kinase
LQSLNYFQQSASILTDFVYNWFGVSLTPPSLTLKNMPATTELLQEGRYRIDHSPTETGEEKTFEAYDTVRNTNVIVREIPVKLNKVATVSQRESLKLAFATQAKALTEIEHDALLHVHDFFSEIDRQYLVMEAIEGESLADQIRRQNKPFSVDEVTSWADQLLDALNYLHSRKPAIIHRNINPGNVKVGPSGKVKLLGVGVESSPDSEFGASQVDDEELRYSPMEQIWPGLDPASQKVITNSYDDRSERILKQPLDERSDIYALGATLYFLITGVEPVDPLERSIEILEGKLDPLPEPSKVDPRIPADISDVLMKALEIKRENRFDSAMIMRQVLQTALGRVLERNEGDAREQTEAAEQARRAEQAKAENERRLQAEAEERRREAEAVALRLKQEAEAEEKRHAEAEAEARKLREAKAEEQRQRELMEQELRAAEEKRIKAEQAAEEARIREEAESVAAARAAEATRHAEPVLAPLAEVVAYRETSSKVEEEELAAVLKELEEAEVEAEGHARSASQPHDADVAVVYETPLDMAPEAAPMAMSSEDDDEINDIFSVPEKTGFSLPMPAIAGMIGLVFVIAIGGYFVMSGSSDNAKHSAASVQVEQPQTVEPTPSPDAIVSSTNPQADTASVTEPTGDQPAASAKATPKPKKADAKADPAKKKVTVDDLINDN